MEKRIELELRIKNEKNLFILSKQIEKWRLTQNGYGVTKKINKDETETKTKRLESW